MLFLKCYWIIFVTIATFDVFITVSRFASGVMSYQMYISGMIFCNILQHCPSSNVWVKSWIIAGECHKFTMCFVYTHIRLFPKYLLYSQLYVHHTIFVMLPWHIFSTSIDGKMGDLWYWIVVANGWVHQQGHQFSAQKYCKHSW